MWSFLLRVGALMCSCWSVNVVFTVTNAVLFPLHTLSLLLICLLCICKYLQFLLLNLLFSYFFLWFPVDVEIFLQKAKMTPTFLPHFLSAVWLESLPFYLTSVYPSLPHKHTHTHAQQTLTFMNAVSMHIKDATVSLCMTIIMKLVGEGVDGRID